MPTDPCSRESCDLCCRNSPVTLSNRDIRRLEDAGLPTKKFVEKQGGYLVLAQSSETCILLSAGRCTAYDSRPDLCRAYPFVAGDDGTGGRSEECPWRAEFGDASELMLLAIGAIEIQDDEAEAGSTSELTLDGR